MKKNVPIVFFNASVILSGLYSPTGGSAKILDWSKNKKIQGVVSETVIDEVYQKSPKLGLKLLKLKAQILNLFSEITPPPVEINIQNFIKLIIDYGDAHVLASTKEARADYLVSLDKKHILSLKRKIKTFSIVSPGELIEILSKKQALEKL